MHRRRRSLVALVTSVALLAGLIGPALAIDSTLTLGEGVSQDGEPESVAKSRSGQLAETDPALLGRTDSTPIGVLIKLDYDAVASYTGDVPGLAATSPEVTGVPLAANPAAVDAYTAHISQQEAATTAAIQAIAPGATVTNSFQTVYGGVAAIVPANQVGALLGVEGVAAVQADALQQPLTDVTPEFVGATAAWAQISDSTTAGQGVIVGVLDTGIWPEHPSFADNGITHPGGTYGCGFGDGSDPALGDPFTCNDKLIGAYAFTNTYMNIIGALDGEFCNNDTNACSARDANGHGTHTSSTAAGSHVAETPLLGMDRGPISGIAPGAHVIMYRVCLDQGCFGSDSVAAVDQAIEDGVDVLNFSISGGSSAYTDAVELAFLDAYAAGILVNASAGNAGPGAGTANHAGPWTNTVGASTSNRHFLTTLSLAADGGATLDITGATVTDGVAEPTSVIVAQDVPGYDADDPATPADERALCVEPLPEGSAAGQVVACERGVIGRLAKSVNVLPSGAAGMILYNLVPANGLGLNTDNHWVPSVHIDQPNGDAFLAFMAGNTGVAATWTTGVATEVVGDVMAPFSSRGPVGDFLKPDVTAPGVQILAGHTPEPATPLGGPPGQMFQAIQGTSMSSPHGAGVAALVNAAHPDWSPGQIKSALMTSSLQSVLKEDGASAATPFDRGAGSIRANRALAPTIVFDVSADDYFASSADPLGRIHLNLPSIYANPMPGAITTTRTATNVSGATQDFTAQTQAPVGSSISVTPSRFSLAPGATLELSITIDGTALADGTYFGQITLDAKKGHDAVLPVTFNKTQGSVTLAHSCAPTTVPRNTVTHCSVTAQNLSPADAQVSLSVSAPSKLKIQNVSAPGVPSGNGFGWNGTLAGSEAPTIDAIEPGETPTGGYFPLTPFVGPIGGMGDESIVNFNLTRQYTYGTEPYSRIGLTSNGYAVVGGGTGQDIEFDPQTLPDPARPNNVLAPFWTDLDFSAGGTLRFATLCVGGVAPCWHVAEWENVPTFSNNATTNSFQIWIGANGEDDISYAFDTVGGPDPVGLTVGAENRDGSSGKNLGATPASGSQYVIQTSPPTPGGSVTITYDALSKNKGTYNITAVMTADTMNGQTVEIVKVTVR